MATTQRIKLYLFLLLTFVTTPLYADDTQTIKDNTRILVMGDSLSAGYGINLEQGWVSLLQTQLSNSTSESEKNWRLINASVSGETSTGGKARLPGLLAKHQPAIVILELGGNDGLRGQPVKRLMENLQTMIDMSEHAGARVLLVGMQIPPNYGARYTEEFKRLYAQLADKNQLPLVPFLLTGVAEHANLMQDDRLHPTAEAQPTLAQNVYQLLKDMLR